MDMSAASKMKSLQGKFRKMGIIMGILSGFTYGVYSTLIGIAYAEEPIATASASTVLLEALAVTFVVCGINDFIAGLWLLIWNAKNGKLAELGRSVKTFPGLMIMLGAIIGGPVANGAYILGISMAGSAAIPISATCALFGALFAWIFLKQKLTLRVIFGMIICVSGAVIINLAPSVGSSNFTLGIICAIVAAIGWGLEGTVSSFGGAILDSDIAVNIRELVSGGIIIVAILPIVKGLGLFQNTLTAGKPMMWIALAALSAAVSFLMWYKANATVGCAVGMSLNVTYALWGVVLSAIFLKQSLTVTMSIGSVVIVIGAILVTMNPFEFLKKGDRDVITS